MLLSLNRTLILYFMNVRVYVSKCLYSVSTYTSQIHVLYVCVCVYVHLDPPQSVIVLLAATFPPSDWIHISAEQENK